MRRFVNAVSTSRRLCAAAAVAVGLALGAGGHPASAGPALVFDADTGEILHAHMATTKWYPASLTKLMAAYVTFAAIEAGRIGLDTPVAIGEGDPALGLTLPPGTMFTVEETLPLVLAASLKFATEALGRTVSGSVDAFVADMNASARRLGMTDTNYVNSHGFHAAGHMTTARDMAVLTRALNREFPQYQRFFEVRSVTIAGQQRRNHNDLLGRFPGADGMKSGYVCESGYNLVGTATREGRRLGAIVLGAFSAAEREAVAEQMLKAGFAASSGAVSVTIDTLPLSQDGPVDMRPFVCGKSQPPAALVGFGTMAPLPRPKP